MREEQKQTCECPKQNDRCGKCGLHRASSIHMTQSDNTEIRLAAHRFIPNDYVAWCRYTDKTIVTCDSDAPGAFPVYRAALSAPCSCAELRECEANYQSLLKYAARIEEEKQALLVKVDVLQRSVDWHRGEKSAAQIDAEREKNIADCLRERIKELERTPR